MTDAAKGLRRLRERKPTPLPFAFMRDGTIRDGEARAMAYAEGWALVRNKGAAVLAASVRDIEDELARLANDAAAHSVPGPGTSEEPR